MERVLVRKVILGIAAKQVSKQNRYDWIYETSAKLLIGEFLCTKRATHFDFPTSEGLNITPSDKKLEQRSKWFRATERGK